MTEDKTKKWYEISGFLEPEDATALQSICKGKIVLEIGSLFGRSTACIAEVAERVHAVDTFRSSGDGQQQLEEISTLRDFKTNTEGYSNIVIHVKTSEEASREFDNESLDVIFIDGNHEYFDVMTDIEYWWTKIKPGGVMVFHDYGPRGWAGVTKAVDKSFSKDNISGPFYCLAYVRK